MKLLKQGILLILALCTFMWSANIILVQAIDDNEINAVSAANQIENYDLKRVLKSKKETAEEEDNCVLHYEHKKTGAQFVCFINDYDDSLQMAYRVPSEDDSGVVHALEHCFMDDGMIDEPENKIPSPFYAETFNFGFLMKVDYYNGHFVNIDVFINSLKNKKFMNDENIFKKQVFNQVVNNGGSILNRGRMFVEVDETMKNLSKRAADICKVCHCELISNNSKLKFMYGGIPEKVASCKYSDVCDACNKYVHPSNSLTIIKSKHFKDVMVKLDKDFMNNYDRRDIKVDYRLPEKNNVEFFSQYNVSRLEDIFGERYDYGAVAAYPLKEIKNDKINTFKNLCAVIESEKIKQKLFDMGYTNIRAELAESIDFPYLKISIAGNDRSKFNQDILVDSFEQILNDCSCCENIEGAIARNRFREDSYNTLATAYAFSGDPFSDRFFTIINNEIVNCERKPEIDKSLLKGLKPEKIAFLTRSKKTFEHINGRYQISFADNDKSMAQFAMRILNRGLVSKVLQEEGSIYKNMFTKSGLDDERACCFYSDESVAFDNITHFFKNNFNEQVRNFVVSDELFNLVKNNIINDKDFLEAVVLSECNKDESVVENKIVDEKYSAQKLETKRDISSITKEEIQNFIRTAQFVGYAIVK